jgi:uncharacterized HAD superfamily protein
MKTIVLDCDDVLAMARVALAEAVSQHKNRFVHWREWSHFDAVHADYKIAFEDIVPILHKNKALENLEPEVGAKIVTRMFKLLGYRVVVVTARSRHPNGYELTEKWLNDNEITFDELYVTDPANSKTDVISKLGEVELFVDDNAKNVIEVSKLDNVKQSVMMNMPWNANVEYEHRVSKLSDALVLLP